MSLAPVAALVLVLMLAALFPAAGLAPLAAAQGQPGGGGIEIGPDPAARPPIPPAPPDEALADVDSIQKQIEVEQERLERQQERLRRLEAQLRRDRVIRRRGGDEDEDYKTGGDGALVRMGQDVEVREGEVVREVVVMGGDLRVRGEVEGDAVAIGGDLTVTEGGKVAGSAVTVGGRLEIEPGAIVEGDQVEVGAFAPGFGGFGGWLDNQEHREPQARGEKIVRAFVIPLAFLLIGWIAMLLFGDRLVRTADLLQQTFGRSLLLGFLILILWLPAVVLTCITVIGIPVGIFLLVAVPFALFAGYLIGAMVFGRRVAAGFVFEQSGALAHLLIGLVALALLGLVGNILGLVRPLAPLSIVLCIMGWVLMSLAAMAGLGALGTAVFQGLRAGRRAGEAPPPGGSSAGELATG